MLEKTSTSGLLVGKKKKKGKKKRKEKASKRSICIKEPYNDNFIKPISLICEIKLCKISRQRQLFLILTDVGVGRVDVSVHLSCCPALDDPELHFF